MILKVWGFAAFGFCQRLDRAGPSPTRFENRTPYGCATDLDELGPPFWKLSNFVRFEDLCLEITNKWAGANPPSRGGSYQSSQVCQGKITTVTYGPTGRHDNLFISFYNWTETGSRTRQAP
jgi:hypothetical protein